MEKKTTNWALWGMALGGSLLLGAVRRRGKRIDFAGKTVLLTGGSRGLGFAMARLLAVEGANLVIGGRDKAALRDAQAQLVRLTHNPAALLTVTCDVGAQDDVERLVAEARRRFSRIDVLINNAGVIEVRPLDTMTLADYDTAMKTHFWGPLYTTMAVLPEFRERGEGRIVNIASFGGLVSVPHLLPYCASKFALVGLSEGLTEELRKENIFVTTVCPGLMRTGSSRNADFKGRHEAEYTWFTMGDAAPLLSMPAYKAASRILSACRDGKPELILGWPVKIATTIKSHVPNLTILALAAVNRLLPDRGDAGTELRKGRESETDLTRSWLRYLDHKAAEALNQFRKKREAS